MGRKLGAVLLLGEAATPSNTTSPGPTPTSIPSSIVHPAVWPQKDIGRKLGGCALLGEGSWVPI